MQIDLVRTSDLHITTLKQVAEHTPTDRLVVKYLHWQTLTDLAANNWLHLSDLSDGFIISWSVQQTRYNFLNYQAKKDQTESRNRHKQKIWFSWNETPSHMLQIMSHTHTELNLASVCVCVCVCEGRSSRCVWPTVSAGFLPALLCSDSPVLFASPPVLLAGGGGVSSSSTDRCWEKTKIHFSYTPYSPWSNTSPVH